MLPSGQKATIMTKRSIFPAIAAIAAGATVAAANEPPKLPAGARKLNGGQIEALYRDATVVGMNFERGEILSFTAKLSAATRTFTVHVFAGPRHAGSFDMNYRVDGDQWCYRPKAGGAETCVSVHLDGDVIYELTRDGRVSARNIAWR
jgi:hypothetical protein